MPSDVIMPQMGESIVEGTIIKWLKKAGDRVEKDEPLFEISTDKVDAEIPSPAAGILTEIKFPEGITVGINTVVAIIDGSLASGPAVDPQTRPDSVPQAQPATQAAPFARAESTVVEPSSGIAVIMPQMGESIFEGTITKWLKRVGDYVGKDEPLFEISTDKVDAEIPAPIAGILSEIKVAEGVTVEINTVVAVIGNHPPTGSILAPEGQVAATIVLPQVQSTLPQPDGRRIRSSPLVRRIANENNVDLAQVSGTGSEGRITKEDILRHLANPAASVAKAQSAVPRLVDELVPMTKMRAIIGQRMVESLQRSPHAHTVYKVDMTRIARLRQRERIAFEHHNGIKLTFMPFIAAAAVEALRKFPILNASSENGSIRYHRNINLGIAVALEWGLIVPVIREAEQRSFVDLARAIADLAGRARTKKLMPDETTGSTFTLTNSGAFGGEFGMPIINQPESAILAIGGLRKEPMVLTDSEGNDTLAIRSVQYSCLGFDHRTIDGADSGKFMLEFKRTLETWDRKIG